MRTLYYLIALGSALSATAEESLFPKVQEIFASRCIACHNEKSKLITGGNLSLETRADFLKGGKKGSVLIPGDPAKSSVYTTITLPESDPLAMPPVGRFVRVPAAEQEVIKKWIENGAKWPEGEKIIYRRGTPSGDEVDPTELALVEKIRAKILANQENVDLSAAYTGSVEGTRAKFKMVPIPAGSFRFKGKEAGDEFTVHLDGFWMSDKEASWDLYNVFMEPKIPRDKDGLPQDYSQVVEGDTILAQPSRPYHAMSFGMGIRRHPAISMTHHAANKYCQWLSWQTGHFYRLPTEAEWEYAARANREIDAPADIAAVAWFGDNSTGVYGRIGKKQANPWGLHDMMGNVMEWTLDGYVENRRNALGDKDEVKNPWIRATKPYPHVCKGGHYASPASELTFGVRTPSASFWKISDPQTPKSIWYHSNMTYIGFRPVRPAKVPSAEEMYRYWNSGVAYDEE